MVTSFCLLLVLAVAPAGPATTVNPREWTVERLGLRFELTADELRAWKGAQAPVFSIRALLAEDKRKFDASAEEGARERMGSEPPRYAEQPQYGSVAYKPLSVVGPLVSYLEVLDGYSPGAAHPFAFETIQARDVSRDGTAISLMDLYSDRQILDALKADPWIRKFTSPKGTVASAATLAELVAFLNEARDTSADPDSCAMDASFGTDLVQHFAFHHLEGGRVAVRIAIPYSAEVCRGTLHQVGLLLPIPEGLRGDLQKAERLESGFLMKDVKRLGSPVYSDSWEVDLRALARQLRKPPP